MSPPVQFKTNESNWARTSGAGAAGASRSAATTSLKRLILRSGVAELLVFHPVDTIAKRLMSNTTKVSIELLLKLILI
jgi:hypothetical protein